jgi:NAD(P)-dependent dehydrogenase (short-subunit alcohol dehydrogenase family)
MEYLAWTALAGACAWLLRQHFKGGVCYSTKQLTGRTVLITGANTGTSISETFFFWSEQCVTELCVITGIGFETALDMARRGARVIIACRNLNAMNSAVEQLKQQSNNSNIVGMQLDLADLHNIRQFAAQFVSQEQRLDILILNAGVMALPTLQRTKDDFEMQMGTNHFGTFLSLPFFFK